MKLGKLGLIALVFSLTLVLAACGGDDDGGDNGGDTGGSGGGAVNLSQTVTGGSEVSGMLTLKYPEGWVSRVVDDRVYFGDSEATLDKIEADENPSDDDIGGIAAGLPGEAISEFIGSDDASAVDILTAMTGIVGDQAITFELGDPEEFTSNGRNGALVTGSGTSQGDVKFDALFVGAFAGDDFIMVVMRSPEGKIGQYEDTAKAMVGEATYEYTAPSS